ncbi:hypothetical protein ALC56_13115 [Trachymyrmex septentrionalis]|uniref:Uncharacterized protein n=1 Tax=Trachymyrmex septentrionalis TaxID=34720 RepID=A0A195EWM6_9HYME|nr:PREDICTED: uncharacterized protein LOC108754299 [Trachymyrmex septentrionalis]KYN32633.1 hypothetical protein ALC56_13115 [Trachymyrmex septentrionalis]
MNVTTGVRVRIYDEERCIHEHETVRSDGDDLRTLIQNLRDMQSEINCFLTTLIQRRDVSSEMMNQSISSDIHSDSLEEEEEKEEKKEDEIRTNPKKSKLS